MHWPRSFAIVALLVVAGAGLVASSPTEIDEALNGMIRSFDNVMQKYDHNKETIEKYNSVAEQCGIDTAKSILRVVDTMNFLKYELRVHVEGNNITLERGPALTNVSRVFMNRVWKMKEVSRMPPKTDAAAVTAKLTVDDFLLLSFPRRPSSDKRKNEKKTRQVPIETCEESIDGERPPNYEAFKLYTMFRRFDKCARIESVDHDYDGLIVTFNAVGIKKDDLTVLIKDGFLFVYSTVKIEEFPESIIATVKLPQHAALGAAEATLFVDSHLIVKVPVDPSENSLVLGDRYVTVNEV